MKYNNLVTRYKLDKASTFSYFLAASTKLRKLMPYLLFKESHMTRGKYMLTASSNPRMKKDFCYVFFLNILLAFVALMGLT
ncbi:hypothetical protein BpHYR1_018451 [Brachionus plicatilis]|uniref:Uncharacterized protein n=1 Tax=Brachionus plicatilis TaxID=10195 RepID=A0A3M7PQ12_BRAPC|nr:hypothetical protein BpHYR1_018451 [Brachionus plicatilis]